LLWVRTDDVPATWNNLGNFRDISTGNARNPQANDDIIFDPTRVVSDGTSTWQGTNEPSTANIALTFGSITVASGYTKTITLSNDLTFKGLSSINGGIFAEGGGVQRTLTFDAAGGFSSVTLRPLGKVEFAVATVFKANVTTTIDGFVEFHRNVENSGRIDWLGADISLSETFTNRSGGLLDIQCDKKIELLVGGNNPKLLNQGTMKKSPPIGFGMQTDINVNFQNVGTLDIRVGTISFNKEAKQTAPGSVTYLWSGAEMIASTYFVNKGSFYGEGTFYGTLSNGDPAEAGTGGIVHPGIADGTAGTLTIYGNYVQTANGTLYIEFTGAGVGQTSVLDVQQNGGVGGTVTMGGSITVHRDSAFFPGAMTREFMRYASINGTAILSSDPANDTWFDGAGIPRTFSNTWTAGGTSATFSVI
jgi:hypothetical protein